MADLVRRSRGFVYAVVLLLAAASGLSAQVPTLPPGMTQEDVLRIMRTQPQLVQQQLRASGLSADEIRGRLRQAGYPENLLDMFLGDSVPRGSVSSATIGALTVLGVEQVFPAGIEDLSVETGLTRRDSLRALPSAVFGLDLFRGRTTQFQPVLSGPVPETYRIGPGDLMVLLLTGDVELVHQLPVTREGFILIPQVGQLFVNNVTMTELRGLLRQRLARSYSGIETGTTHFDITIARLRTIQVFVTGEIIQPGAYQLASVATVLNALYAAGGPTARGNLRQIRVERGDETVATFDLYDYLLTGTAASDIVLEQGDRIFVPIRGPRIAVSGAVIRPGVFEIEPGEQLRDALWMAGGLRADALTQRVTVHRILPPASRGPGAMSRAALDVPLVPGDPDGDGARAGGLAGLEVPPFPLVGGDSVVVDFVPPRDRSLFVTIGGIVAKPGRYPWSPGMTLRDLVLLARGPTIGADLREAEIARLPEDRTEGALARSFRVPLDSTYLFERDASGAYLGPAGVVFPAAGTASEVPLDPFDHTTIFRQPGFELQRTVTVTGEVRFPGPYALEQRDERISSLVRRAGGVRGPAYLDGARFFRSLDTAGRVNVNLAAALRDPGGREDLILQPGDSLDIPEFVPIVRVSGAVNSPVSVRYEEGRDFDYYIANAGGFAHDADKGRTSVRYADGTARVRSKFLFFTSYPTPGPGSTIVVPEEPEGLQGLNWPVVFGGIAQILSAVTTILLVVQRL